MSSSPLFLLRNALEPHFLCQVELLQSFLYSQFFLLCVTPSQACHTVLSSFGRSRYSSTRSCRDSSLCCVASWAMKAVTIIIQESSHVLPKGFRIVTGIFLSSFPGNVFWSTLQILKGFSAPPLVIFYSTYRKCGHCTFWCTTECLSCARLNSTPSRTPLLHLISLFSAVAP